MSLGIFPSVTFMFFGNPLNFRYIHKCQRPVILSSRSERILSVRDKVKCQGGDKEKLTQPEGNVSFRKREQKLPAKTHEALRSLPSVALSSVVGKSLSIKRVHGT